MKHQVKRYHDISCGHRVVGHESCCSRLHGHNYRVHFVCEADCNKYVGESLFGGSLTHNNQGLDQIGRVIDFSEIKTKLCMWLEDNWDHKFLAWEKDLAIKVLSEELFEQNSRDANDLNESFVFVSFNPTAENMAQYLVECVGPIQLRGTGITLTSVTIEETRKCSVSYGS